MYQFHIYCMQCYTLYTTIINKYIDAYLLTLYYVIHPQLPYNSYELGFFIISRCFLTTTLHHSVETDTYRDELLLAWEDS